MENITQNTEAKTEKIYFRSNLVIVSEENLDTLAEKQEVTKKASWYAIDFNAWSPIIKTILAWNTVCSKKIDSNPTNNIYVDGMTGRVHYDSASCPIMDNINIHYDSTDFENNGGMRVIFDFFGTLIKSPTRSIKEYLSASLIKYGSHQIITDVIDPFNIIITPENNDNWIIKEKIRPHWIFSEDTN